MPLSSKKKPRLRKFFLWANFPAFSLRGIFPTALCLLEMAVLGVPRHRGDQHSPAISCLRRLDFCARACYTISMKYDYVALYNKNAAFYEGHPRLKKALLLFNTLAPLAFVAGYLLLVGYGCVELSSKELSVLLFAPASALLSVTALRITANRPRPYDTDGAGITPLRKKESSGKSFPSRHLASAAAIALSFLRYFPAVGVVFLLLGLTLGYTRFATGWHYPSDLIVGFLLGLALGAFIFLL